MNEYRCNLKGRAHFGGRAEEGRRVASVHRRSVRLRRVREAAPQGRRGSRSGQIGEKNACRISQNPGQYVA